ncbi:hypothetical protein Hanom_Chr00s000002g01599271 [Helianthus anomalus]
MSTMEDALDQIMSLMQESTVSKYCDEIQILFDKVNISEEISEYYAIYLFSDGLEPKIRDVFITWHQYSFHTLKDYISLALKLDANKLKDSFSPCDPNSSLYEPHRVFDIVSGNDNGETSEDMGEDSRKYSMEYDKDGTGSSSQDMVIEIQEIIDQDSCDSEYALNVFEEMPKIVSGEKIENLGDDDSRKNETDNNMFENEIGSSKHNLSIELEWGDHKIVKEEPDVTIGMSTPHLHQLENPLVLMFTKLEDQMDPLDDNFSTQFNWLDMGWNQLKAVEIVSKALKLVLSFIRSNAKIVDICEKGNSYIRDKNMLDTMIKDNKMIFKSNAMVHVWHKWKSRLWKFKTNKAYLVSRSENVIDVTYETSNFLIENSSIVSFDNQKSNDGLIEVCKLFPVKVVTIELWDQVLNEGNENSRSFIALSIILPDAIPDSVTCLDKLGFYFNYPVV